MKTSLHSSKFTASIFLAIVYCCISTAGFGQAAAATWPLTSNAVPTPVTGNITAGNHSFNGALTQNSPAYGTDGASAKGWPTSTSTDATKYYQFTLTANVGSTLTITEIDITHKMSTSTGSVNIQYAFNSSFTSPVNYSSFNVTTTSTTTVYFPSISVSGGQTIYFRLYGYNISNTGRYLNIKNFKLIGSTVTCSSPDASNFSVTGATNVCAGTTASTVSVSSTTLPTGSYTITYGLSAPNAISNQTATLSFTSGAPGTGTFTIPAAQLSVAGTTTVTVSKISSGTGCDYNISSGNTASVIGSASAPATPVTVSGSTSVCPSSSALYYQVAPVANATSYNWAVPAGWTIDSGAGGTKIKVTSGGIGQGGNITVSASNGCGTSSAYVTAVSIIALANNTITAPQTICKGTTPTPLTGSLPTGGTTYTYTWLRSTTSASTGYGVTGTGQNFAPGPLSESAWYKRVVTSGGCTDTSAVLYISVITTSGAISPSSSTICSGDIVTLTAVGAATFDAQDFSDNAHGWSHSNVLNNPGGLNNYRSINNGSSSNTDDWVRYSSGFVWNGNTFQTYDSSDFLMSAANYPGQYSSTILHSLSFNTTGMVNCDARFTHSYNYIGAGDTAYFEVSTDDVSWTTVKKYYASVGASNNFVSETINLNAYANMPVVYVRLRYYGFYGGWWAIDNLSLNGSSNIPVSYVWSPATYLYSDSAATTPYVAGTPASVVYSKPTADVTYSIVTSGGTCYSTNTATITVNAVPETVTVSGGGTFCGNTTISASGGAGGTIYYQGTNSLGTSTADTGTTQTISASGNYYFRALNGNGCWSAPGSVTATVNQPPVITGDVPDTFIYYGNNASFTVSNTGSPVSYQWEASGDNGVTWNALSNTAPFSGVTTATLNITTPEDTMALYQFRVVITSTAGCGGAGVSNGAVLYFYNTWVGNVSSDWNTPANWSDSVVPTQAASHVLIKGNRPFDPEVSGVPVAEVNNLHILKNAVLTLNNGTIRIAGTIMNKWGTFNATGGTIELNGSVTQAISGSVFASRTIKNLTISNAAGVNNSTDAGDTLKISALMKFGNVNTTFNTGDNLTLLSNAAGTAAIGDLTNDGANSNSVAGKVTVERYIGPGRRWQFLSIPTNTTQTFRQSWQEGNAATQNSKPGYGTMITDNNSGTYLANGFDYFSPGGPSVKRYNVATGGYTAITRTDTAINVSGGYMTYVRGDRSCTPANTTQASTVLRTTGTLKQGIQGSLTVPTNTFIDIGNPYASAVDMAKINKPGVQDLFYIWDPMLGGSSGLGGFQTFANFDGDYYATPGGGSYPAFGVPFNQIQSGQGFFVRGAAGGTITFEESDKSTGSRQVFRTNSETELVRANLYYVGNGTTTMGDGVMAQYDDIYENTIDDLDAIKIMNPGLNVSIKRFNKLLIVERRKTITYMDTIFLNLTGLHIQNYQWELSIQNMDYAGRAAFLVDKYTGVTTILNLNGSTYLNFAVDNMVASAAADRFMIIFNQPRTLPVTITNVSATRNSDRTISVNWKSENETSMQDYIIERSADGRNFTAIADRITAMNTSRLIAYTQVDQNPLSGDNFYRIKATGLSGQVQYSNIVKVAPLKAGSSIVVYPNPVVDRTVNLYFNNKSEGKYQVQLVNLAGQVVYNSPQDILGNSTVISFNVGKNVTAGNYQLVVIAPDGTKFSHQVLIQ
jgi:hypothetical protein